MAKQLENGSEKKMAEGGNDAELFKEKANKYFKGKLATLSRKWLLVDGFKIDNRVTIDRSEQHQAVAWRFSC